MSDNALAEPKVKSPKSEQPNTDNPYTGLTLREKANRAAELTAKWNAENDSSNSYTGATPNERAYQIAAIAAEGPYDPFVPVNNTTKKFLDAVYYFFKQELGFVDETIDKIKIKDRETQEEKVYTDIPVLQGNRHWHIDLEGIGDSNSVYVFYDKDKSPKIGISYQARGKGGRLDYFNYLYGVHIDEQGQIRNINPDPKIIADIVDNKLKNFTKGRYGKGKSNKSNSRAAEAIIAADSLILNDDISAWTLPAPTGKPDKSVHLIPNRMITKRLRLTGGKEYGYETESKWAYGQFINGEYSENNLLYQLKYEVWRKGEPESQPTSLYVIEDLDYLIKKGHRQPKPKPRMAHDCFAPEYADEYGGHGYYKYTANCPYCYPDTDNNHPNNRAPYGWADVTHRLQTGDYIYRAIIIVSSEKTADIWRSKGFLVLKLLGSELTTPHYFNEIQAEEIAKLVYNRNIDIFVEVEKDTTGMLRVNYELISSMVGPLVRYTKETGQPEHPSNTNIYPFTYHGDLKSKADGEKAIADGLTVEQITTGLDQIRTNILKAKREDNDEYKADQLTPEQIAERKATPSIPVKQDVEHCENIFFRTRGVPGICQDYFDAVLEKYEAEDENGNKVTKYRTREGVTVQDKINTCQRCYTNTEVKPKILSAGIRHDQFGATLSVNQSTENLLERIRYHLKKSDRKHNLDFTSSFVMKRFYSDEDDTGFYSFIANVHSDGPKITAQGIKNYLEENLPTHIYQQLIDAGFQILRIDTKPQKPEQEYLDNLCGRLVAEDDTVIEIGDFGRLENLRISVVVKGRKADYPVLNEQGEPREYKKGDDVYYKTCEFVDYHFGSNMHRLALDEEAASLVYTFGPSMTKLFVKILKDEDINIDEKVLRQLTEGDAKLYIKDLTDFTPVKSAYNKKEASVLTDEATNIALKLSTDNSDHSDFSNDKYKSAYKRLIPGNGISARYYSAEQASNSINGLVFGEAAAKEMIKQISMAYQVNTNTAEVIYNTLKPIQRAHPNLLPGRVQIINKESKKLSDKLITYENPKAIKKEQKQARLIAKSKAKR